MKRTFLVVVAMLLLAVSVPACGVPAGAGFEVGPSVTVTLGQTVVTTQASAAELARESGPAISFVAPRGTGDGRIKYEVDPCATWGPTSFCVLPDGSVAILECSEECVELFSASGEPLRTLHLDGTTISPVDLRWWNDHYAILEFSTQPKSVPVLDADGNVSDRIDLWDGMDETAMGLMIGRDGRLELLARVDTSHVIAEADGTAYSPQEILDNRQTPVFRGGPRIEYSYSEDGSLRGRLAGSSEWIALAPQGTVGATPVGADDAGNTYVRTSRMLADSVGNYIGGDSLVVKLDADLRQVGYAPIDMDGLMVIPTRMIDVTADGTVYSMVPKEDGVHIDTLRFSSTVPELTPTIASSDAAPIVISGPATVERPRGTELFEMDWGGEEGELGLGTEEERQMGRAPAEMAISPDGNMIALLDSVNSRVQLVTLQGTVERIVPLPSDSYYGEVFFDRQGALLLTSGDSVFKVAGDCDRLIPAGVAWEYAVCGPTAVDDSLTCDVMLLAPGSWAAVIRDPQAKTLRNVALSATRLPITDVRVLGRDYAGNFYLMVRIDEESWDGTPSWCVVGITPGGDCLGQLRLPQDSWAGSGCAVTPGGAILELRSTQEGVVLTEFELRSAGT